MSKPSFKQLLLLLVQKTLKKEVTWQDTLMDTSFKIGIGDGVVRVEKSSYFDEDTDSYSDFYSAFLENQSGAIAEEIIAYRGEDLDILSSLYKQARRSALKADALLESMLQDLKEGNTVQLEDEMSERVEGARLSPSEASEGMRVVHRRFGEGVIKSLVGRGDSMVAVVEFDDKGTKSLHLKFAPLRPVK